MNLSIDEGGIIDTFMSTESPDGVVGEEFTYDPSVLTALVGSPNVSSNDRIIFENSKQAIVADPSANTCIITVIIPTVSFESIAGDPSDNALLNTALSAITTNITNLQNNKLNSNTAITAGTATKITYDSKGLITGSSNLTATDIPTITQAQVTGLTTALAGKEPSLPSGGTTTQFLRGDKTW